MQDDIKEIISMAKLRMAVMSNTQFMFALCCKLNTVITDSIDTAATNGVDLLINPTFFNSLSQDEQVFLLAHETLHVAYLHTVRRENRQPVKFNCACDYVINSELLKRDFKMIEGGLYDPQYDGLSSEEVYNLLSDSQEQPQLGMDIIPSEEDSKVAEQAIQNIISAVHMAEQTHSKESIPDVVRQFMTKFKEPKINWRIILRRFLLETDKTDYSWKRPNRRQLYSGRYMPSMYDNNLAKITFAIDVSASITQDMFTQFISEVRNIFKQMKPKSIEIIQFHHTIAHIDQVTSVNDFDKVQFLETGGTCLIDVMKYMKPSKSKALVVITDGYFDHKYDVIRIPTLWCIFDNESFKPNFGHTLTFKLEEQCI